MKPITSEAWVLNPQGPAADAQAELSDGGQLRVVFLSETMARLSWVPREGFREPRTWSIAPEGHGDVPWEGRARASLAGVERPAVGCACSLRLGRAVRYGPSGQTPAVSRCCWKTV